MVTNWELSIEMWFQRKKGFDISTVSLSIFQFSFFFLAVTGLVVFRIWFIFSRPFHRPSNDARASMLAASISSAAEECMWSTNKSSSLIRVADATDTTDADAADATDATDPDADWSCCVSSSICSPFLYFWKYFNVTFFFLFFLLAMTFFSHFSRRRTWQQVQRE